MPPKKRIRKSRYSSPPLDNYEEDAGVADDDTVRHHPSRVRKSYKETSSSEDEKDEEENQGETEIKESFDDNIPTASPTKRAKSKRSIESDDDEFMAEDDDEEEDDEDDPDVILSSEDEKVLERRRINKFIERDDEDEEAEDYEYGQEPPNKKSKKSSRGRKRKQRIWDEEDDEPVRTTRSARLNISNLIKDPNVDQQIEGGGDDDDVDDIQKEIADLKDSVFKESPVQHKLRERPKVDYYIPPPISNDYPQLEPRPSTPRRGRGRVSNKNEFRKILYPTAGPFGGSDVISLFGTNIPPGGIPIPGMPINVNNNNLTAIGQNLSDSDSSEDEIAPINGEATISKKQPKSLKPAAAIPPNNNSVVKLITGGSDDSKNKKKNSLSDTDPLGIDMNIDFSVVGGLDNYINQLKEMVALPLLYPELYQNFKITPPRGVLFHGPPGTGKTLMARALAASCSTAERKITFFMRKGADCLSKWVGEAERQLRLLFEEAKNQQPSIIFFDEIDGLAPVRSSKQEQIHASIVSTLLALMDGMDNRGQVIVIGATNRPDSIDPALRRPGRFDREFYFPLPDISARKEILKIHTRGWSPELPEVFVDKLAELTKGYGGADLRALCTEAALHSIQRKYPQIYSTNEKLQVDPKKVKVIAKDFMKAIEKIIPSSARSTSSGSAPLPEHLKPLLQDNMNEIIAKWNELLPNSRNQKKITSLEEAQYLDPTTKDPDGGFGKLQILKNLESSRICRPHLLIGGAPGSGQQYLAQAILNYLEGFQVQSLDMGTIFGDPTRTPDSIVVQAFIEARRHQPSIIFIPNIDIWFQIVPGSARATLLSLIRNLNSSERVLMLGISEIGISELDEEIKLIFGFESESNNVCLKLPNLNQRSVFFEGLKNTLLMKPFEFVNDLENRPKRKLKQLPVVKAGPKDKLSQEALAKKQLKEQEYNDTKLKNVLKIKLAGLMDLFKNRYKRFRKPVIDENYLYHLFDPTVINNPMTVTPYEVLYEKSTDLEHENMIREISTGRYFYNMDLDIIEERLWNGYYSEPKQFLRDIKMIVKDSITSGDRERILKANEMLTNAQFGIDDFSTPEFLKACKEVRERDLIKQQKLLEEHKKLQLEFEKSQELNLQTLANAELDNTAANNGHEKNGVVVVSEPVPVVPILNGPTIISESTSEGATESLKNDAVAAEVVENEEQQQIVEDPIEEEEQQHPSDSESEAEIEIEIDDDKQLIIDEERLNELYNKLIEISEGFNIEKLEITMARLMDIIWKDRNQWNKIPTLDKLYETLESIK
ncbi:YTA7 [[Candida] subhashii]|uniref:YTA7 n=1 Tax=[Candida] subhashii TaxID=561895 RepID=A0A8J5UMM8_9ASCO|nr:YTA7 [[Candida] subhashii]KAG7666198.1 YTA7 [[Candida] subhashii]